MSTATTSGMRVLVTGSARWTCWRTIMAALSLVWESDAVLVTGACPDGAEGLAARCWTSWGGQVERWPFDWDRAGGSVVAARHAAMLEAGADVCFGFANTGGPTSLTTMARTAGVATHEWPSTARRG